MTIKQSGQYSQLNPSYLYSFYPDNASKFCMENGTWVTKADYMMCVPPEDTAKLEVC